jgi:hypothetical protein
MVVCVLIHPCHTVAIIKASQLSRLSLDGISAVNHNLHLTGPIEKKL